MTLFASIELIKASGKVSETAVEVFDRQDGMGRSVRALRDFSTDQIVCTYGGRLVTDTETASDYVLSINEKMGVAVDGNPSFEESKGHVGNFINDASGPIKDGSQNNVRFSLGYIQTKDGERRRVIWIRATKPIKKGEIYLLFGMNL